MHAIVNISSEFTNVSDVQNSKSRLLKSLHQVLVHEASFCDCDVVVHGENLFDLNQVCAVNNINTKARRTPKHLKL
jgi:hypothetical protein